MAGNWIDWIIVAVIVYFVLDGWQQGFLQLLTNFLSFLGSLWFAVRFHGVVGGFFIQKFGISVSWTNVLGYLAVAMVSQIILEEVFIRLVARLPKRLGESKANRYLGSALSFVNASVILAFVLLLVLSLPLRGTVKSDIRNSVLGKELVLLAERYGGTVTSSLEGITREAVKFLTVEPGSTESIALNIPKGTSYVPDATSEQQMVVLVNKERSNRGIGVLTVDSRMTKVAEDKSLDMFTRRYFSHIDPDGKNAVDRMRTVGVSFTIVGENLAYAPDTDTAEQGLVNSEGHRANILDTRFHRIGIGVIDGGVYGKMFTQEFAD